MLDDRKLKILAAVVDEYILTGEPVGSKAVQARADLNVSAATIRNDMAMLEQLGHLEQPHTSAGRIPTFSGFRLYIEKLMPERRLTGEEKKVLDSYLDVDVPTEDALIESATKALAELTQCAAVVQNISPKFSVITKTEVIPTGKRMYVLLMVTSAGNIQNKICRLEFDLTADQLEFFSRFMAENLEGVSIEDLSDEMIDKLTEALGAYMVTLTPLMKGFYELAKGLGADDIKVSGEKNLLACKEMDQNQIIRFLENKNEVKGLLDESFSGIQVRFGEDGFVISNSSMVMYPIKKGNRTAGSLGVIGPMRINYSKIIPYIEYFSEKISQLISEEDDSKEKED